MAGQISNVVAVEMAKTICDQIRSVGIAYFNIAGDLLFIQHLPGEAHSGDKIEATVAGPTDFHFI